MLKQCLSYWNNIANFSIMFIKYFCFFPGNSQYQLSKSSAILVVNKTIFVLYFKQIGQRGYLVLSALKRLKLRKLKRYHHSFSSPLALLLFQSYLVFLQLKKELKILCLMGSSKVRIVIALPKEFPAPGNLPKNAQTRVSSQPLQCVAGNSPVGLGLPMET